MIIFLFWLGQVKEWFEESQRVRIGPQIFFTFNDMRIRGGGGGGVSGQEIG